MIRMPAEWEPQSLVQLTWPHAQTDWASILPEAQACFENIALCLSAYSPLLIVAPQGCPTGLESQPGVCIFRQSTNDTWARDHGGISIWQDQKPVLLDFEFNGWGGKFDSVLDNQITEALHAAGYFGAAELRKVPLVLEGGSLDSNGAGTILTTKACLLNPNRNPSLSQAQIEVELTRHLGAQNIIWLENGYLEGDDTDAHIDTLARFCSPDTIAYVGCNDPKDVHFEPLQAMKAELQATGLQLVELPFCSPIFDLQGQRLPATYANFLITDRVVWVPAYRTAQDEKAREILQSLFPQRKALSLDCRTLIEQHGSLHCITMQYPLGFAALT
jgi:agmatine/peptidylarginine deiminase